MALTQDQIAAQITALEGILQSGVTTINIDGTTTTIDLNVIRQQLANLRQQSDTERGRKPRIASIYLGGQMGCGGNGGCY